MTPSHVIFGWWLHIFLRQGRFGPGPVGSNDTTVTQEVYNSNAFHFYLHFIVHPFADYETLLKIQVRHSCIQGWVLWHFDSIN